MGKLASGSDIMLGIIEDLGITMLKQSSFGALRSATKDTTELASSIRQRGLLQPIIVRTSGEQFEVVAGNRRLNACKLLGWRKVPCHIIELDDRGAFEVSLIENIQRQTLNPIEEARAFKTYVSDFGWGGVTQLAEKLGKSPSYVTKRIRLLNLPQDIVDSIINATISPSIAQELSSVKDIEQQSELANMIYKRGLSMRKVRSMLNENNDELIFAGSIFQDREKDDLEKILRSFDKSITAIRIAMNRISSIIQVVEGNWISHEILMEHKNMLNSQIDILLKEKKKIIYSSEDIERFFVE